MKRKVKSWESLLICGEIDGESGGIFFRGDEHSIIAFTCDMKHLCGKAFNIDENTLTENGDSWFVTEEMLEPLDDIIAKNYNAGKIRPSLILKDMLFAFKAMLDVREYGCLKYDRLNAFLSMDTEHAEKFLEDNLESIERHYLDISEGQIFDKESKCFHYAHIAIRSMFALMYLQKEVSK